MAKEARNIRLELAAELLKLEAKLNHSIEPRVQLERDRLAAKLIAEARDHLLLR